MPERLLCRKWLREDAPVVSDRRRHTCDAQRIPERYGIGREEGTAEIFLQGFDRPHRSEAIASGEHDIGRPGDLSANPAMEARGALVLLTLRQSGGRSRVDD